jgi:Glutathione S-transferase
MLTVWGRATSSNVQAVMWTIGELGLEHRRIDIGLTHGGNDTAEYLAMNPNGKVPTIRDGDDAPLFESAAIVRYLACKYGDATFWPRDPAHRARLDMWAEWIKTTFGPAFGAQVFFPMVFLASAQRDAAAIARAVEAVKPLARMLDARLGDGPYLDGERFTFADILCGHLLYRYFTHDFERADTPALAAYYERLTARQAYRTHVMVSYEPLRAQE